MKRRFRLSKSADFQRVRRLGKSFPHPLVVLVSCPNDLEITRFAVVASRTIGNAVRRNRSKRLIRAALHHLQTGIKPGWDLIIIARRPMPDANYWQVLSAIQMLLERARLLVNNKDEHPPS